MRGKTLSRSELEETLERILNEGRDGEALVAESLVLNKDGLRIQEVKPDKPKAKPVSTPVVVDQPTWD